MKDADWRDVLIGVYKQMRVQQEMLANTALEVEALSSVLQSNPDFREYYEKASGAQKSGVTAKKLAASLKAIDTSIAGLMTGGKPRSEN